MRASLLASLVFFLSLLPSAGADEADLDAPERALLEAAAECPVTLARALEHAYGSGRHPLQAEIVLDTGGRLMMEAWVRVEEAEAVSFEAWIGPLGRAGWVPARHPLKSESLLAEATRLWAVLEPEPSLLRKVLKGAIRTEERPAPAELALAITPVSDAGERGVSLSVAVDGELRGLHFDPGNLTYALGGREPAPERVQPEERTLPPLEVPEGLWFQAEEAPTLEGWRGKPVLVVVTDPG